jgi:putative ABC transport system permease protein
LGKIEGIEVSVPSTRAGVQFVAGNLNWSAQTQGTTAGYLIAREWTIADGRAFTDAEVRTAAKVVILGQTLAESLFPGENPVGSSVRLNKIPFKVIGLLAAKGQNAFGQDQDDIALIPISTAKKRVFGRRRGRPDSVGSIVIKVFDADNMPEIEELIAETLRDRHRIGPGADDDFSVRNLAEMMELAASASKILSLLLSAVASVSLIVGGIGIMNIMLVSVTERTREIGLRMAVGARRRDILVQFLVEAVTLSVIGGIIGIALGIGGAAAIANFASWPTVISPTALVIAVLFSAGIGIFFGFYPARKAARLDPIDALRYE